VAIRSSTRPSRACTISPSRSITTRAWGP
jgi:hypothetical protein